MQNYQLNPIQQTLMQAANPAQEIQRMFSNYPEIKKFAEMTNGASMQDIENKAKNLAKTMNVPQDRLNNTVKAMQRGQLMDIKQIRQSLGLQ